MECCRRFRSGRLGRVLGRPPCALPVDPSLLLCVAASRLKKVDRRPGRLGDPGNTGTARATLAWCAGPRCHNPLLRSHFLDCCDLYCAPARSSGIDLFATRDRFASWNGTAPLDASSGQQLRHRFFRAGNRWINRTLHIMAAVQLRNATEGRAYYDAKKAAGRTSMEAMRALKRRLSNVVCRRMVHDQRAREAAGPGGHPGTTPHSSVTDLTPDIGSSDKATTRTCHIPGRRACPGCL